MTLLVESAAAQPTQAQQNAIRSNCRSDYMANCSSVKPGGAEALQCLQRNLPKLSSGCQSAVSALNPPSPTPQPASAPAVMPSPVDTPTAARPAAAATGAPAAPAAERHPQPAARPTTVQPASPQGTIASACQSDFRSHCKGVKPGGPAAHQCLQRHAGSLSPACARAMVASEGGAPAAATATAPAATAAPAAEAVAAPAPAAPARPIGPFRRALRERMMEQQR